MAIPVRLPIYREKYEERNFNSYLLYNSFRRNGSGWCGFTYIDDLHAAPKAKDCNDWK